MPTETLIAISVNGKSRDVPAGLTLADVLHHVGLDAGQTGIAVALGEAVVPRSRWTETRIVAGAEIEVITASQGG